MRSRRVRIGRILELAGRRLAVSVFYLEPGATIQDTGLDPELAVSASVKDVGIRSVLAVPIREGAEPSGVIYLDSAASQKVFSSDDLAILEGAAEHVAAALRNAREREALLARAERLEEMIADEVRREHDLSHIVARSAAMKTLA